MSDFIRKNIFWIHISLLIAAFALVNTGYDLLGAIIAAGVVGSAMRDGLINRNQ